MVQPRFSRSSSAAALAPFNYLLHCNVDEEVMVDHGNHVLRQLDVQLHHVCSLRVTQEAEAGSKRAISARRQEAKREAAFEDSREQPRS